MNKRKLLLVAMALSMVAILAVGGTLAYFTAEDGEDNVFTMGFVDIDLVEDFDEARDLVPGLDIGKEVWVENIGDNETYVRVHIAIPSNMDDGDPSFEAVNNFIHWNFDLDNFQAEEWSWLPEYTKEGVGYEAHNWNFYTTTVNDVSYNVYVATYRGKLAPNTATPNVLEKVYLEKTVNAVPTRNEKGEVVSVTYTDTKGNEVTLTPEQMNNIQIKVWAEATQVETFTDAYDALNTAFGVPGSYNPWAE